MTSGPVVTGSLRAARLAVAVAVCTAPLAHALLLRADGLPVWPTLLALAAGLGARVVRPQSTAPLLAALALGPLWQAGTALVTGSLDIERLMPWLAAIGAWLAWPATSAWHVSGVWQFGVVTWALVLAVTWPVTAWRELDYTLQTIGVPTANGSVSLSPQLSAAYVSLLAQAQLVALLLFDWTWGAREPARRRAWLALAPAVAIACLLALWQQVIDPTVLSTEPWIGLRRAAGPFFDGNAMGALAALFAAALAGPGLRPARVPAVAWSGAWMVLALAGVAATGSRTGLGALAGSTIVTVLVVLRPRARLAAAGGLVLLVAAGLAAARVGPASDEATGHAFGRLAGTARRVADGGVSELLSVAWRRDGYGPASLAVIADHPWFGVGPGAFGGVVTDYAATVGLRLPPDNAQNWWREQLAELGIVGGAAPWLCSILVGLALLRAWRATRPDAARAAPLVTLGLMALVSPGTQHPVLLALAGLLVGHGTAPRDHTAPAGIAAGQGAGWVSWTVALACGLALTVTGWTSFRPPHRAARFHFVYDYGISPTAQTPFGEGRWSAAHSVAVFPPDHRVLVVRAVLPHTDLANAPVTIAIGDGYRVVCRAQRRDHAPLECPMVVADGRWPMVEVNVSRPWFGAGGAEQSALLSGRFVREP